MSKKECFGNIKLYADTITDWHDRHPDIKATNPKGYFVTQGGYIGRRTYMQIQQTTIDEAYIDIENEMESAHMVMDDNSVVFISTYGMTMNQKRGLNISPHIFDYNLWCLRPQEFIYGIHS